MARELPKGECPTSAIPILVFLSNTREGIEQNCTHVRCMIWCFDVPEIITIKLVSTPMPHIVTIFFVCENTKDYPLGLHRVSTLEAQNALILITAALYPFGPHLPVPRQGPGKHPSTLGFREHLAALEST